MSKPRIKQLLKLIHCRKLFGKAIGKVHKHLTHKIIRNDLSGNTPVAMNRARTLLIVLRMVLKQKAASTAMLTTSKRNTHNTTKV